MAEKATALLNNLALKQLRDLAQLPAGHGFLAL